MVQTDGIDPGSSVMSNTFSTITESPLQFFFSRYAAVLVAMVRFSLLSSVLKDLPFLSRWS